MAFETPAHGEGLVHLNNFHRVDTAVTTRATYANRNMRLMGEVRVVGQLMHSNPGDRFPCLVRMAHKRELRTILFNLDVTVHARLRRGDGGMVCSFHRVVAVPAIQAQLTSMKLVAKGHGLLGPIAYIGVLGRKPVPNHPSRGCATEKDERDKDLGDLVRPAGKDGRHFSVHLSRSGARPCVIVIHS